MNMSRMTPLCGNLHRAVAAGRLWTEIAADLRRSRGRFGYRTHSRVSDVQDLRDQVDRVLEPTVSVQERD